MIEKDTKAWEYRLVTELSSRDVHDVLDGVVDRGSPVAVKRLSAHLHRFFRWCVDRGIIHQIRSYQAGQETELKRVHSDNKLKAV